MHGIHSDEPSFRKLLLPKLPDTSEVVNDARRPRLHFAQRLFALSVFAHQASRILRAHGLPERVLFEVKGVPERHFAAFEDALLDERYA